LDKHWVSFTNDDNVKGKIALNEYCKNQIIVCKMCQTSLTIQNTRAHQCFINKLILKQDKHIIQLEKRISTMDQSTCDNKSGYKRRKGNNIDDIAIKHKFYSNYRLRK